MSGTIPVCEAKRWVEKTASGGSRSQVFELRDGRYAVVKFPENPQGTRVLVNEFTCCSLAEVLHVPVNLAILVAIDGRLLKGPQATGECPAEFTGGIRCGLVRFPEAVAIGQNQLPESTENSQDLHSLDVFDAWVARGDGRQLLAYPSEPRADSKKLFSAIDYGYAFGGSPAWTTDSIKNLPSPVLPAKDPFTGNDYSDGAQLAAIIDRLRMITRNEIDKALSKIEAPRWDVSVEEIQALGETLDRRKHALVEQFDAQYKRQMEVFNDRGS